MRRRSEHLQIDDLQHGVRGGLGYQEIGVTIERSQIVLNRPIKELGLHPIKVALHPEVAVEPSAGKASASNAGSDSGLDLLRTEKRQIEQKLAAARDRRPASISTSSAR